MLRPASIATLLRCHGHKLTLLSCGYSSKIEVPKDKLTLSFSRSSGAGGQNVNKLNTKVEVRFSIVDADWIPSDVKDRLIEQNPNMVNSAGEFILTSSRFRTQPDNIKDALSKLEELVDAATEQPKARIATSPPKSANEQRIQEKKTRSNIKKLRSSRDYD